MSDDESAARRKEGQPRGETGDRPAEAEVTPAGRAGADSGAAPVVGIDEESRADSTDRGSQNDIPGVGPRGAERDDDHAD